MRFMFDHVFIVGFVSIGLMTMFSYAWSSIRKKKFSEPQLLNDLIGRLTQMRTSGPVQLTGWLIHYLVGVFFIVLYQIYWNATDTDPTIVNGMILGAFNGLIGICGWKLTFFLHPNPPLIDFKEYYLQLFLAHVIFGLTASTTFILITQA